ncbi:MAG: GNAT family N-acetyltransferase [Clostridia bacterium]|nr:GNAT family N-acetyltransferase [Clostridia bacterium]
MIRKYRCEDRQKVLNMMREFYSSPAVLHKIPEQNYAKTLDEAEKSSPYLDVFILEYGNDTAGYALMAYTYSNEAGGNVAWIEEIYVLPEYRSKGLGREFITFIKREYGDFARIRLEVEQSNDGATRLYKREGFEELAYCQYIIDKKH